MYNKAPFTIFICVLPFCFIVLIFVFISYFILFRASYHQKSFGVVHALPPISFLPLYKHIYMYIMFYIYIRVLCIYLAHKPLFQKHARPYKKYCALALLRVLEILPSSAARRVCFYGRTRVRRGGGGGDVIYGICYTPWTKVYAWRGEHEINIFKFCNENKKT